jgi:hypothetical protein
MTECSKVVDYVKAIARPEGFGKREVHEISVGMTYI